MKKDNIIYWAATGLIFLFEGVMPALTSQTEMAKEGISHLGYPAYFGVLLTVFKVTGAVALIVPQVSAGIKEWAYAGFTFNLISACVSNWAVFGFGLEPIMPIIIWGILMLSYVYFHKKMAGKA